ncbi:MAG: molybdopterin-binding protein, partial [Phycisphaerae bacterium]
MKTARLIAIGTELTTGQSIDTNSAWLAQRLAERGIRVVAHACVSDDQPAIVETFQTASARSDLVISTGGLGPTYDDLTRAAH